MQRGVPARVRCSAPRRGALAVRCVAEPPARAPAVANGFVAGWRQLCGMDNRPSGVPMVENVPCRDIRHAVAPVSRSRSTAPLRAIRAAATPAA